MAMRIREFARLTGISDDSLRRLHAAGKLIPAMVSEGGHRLYDERQAEEAARYVKTMRLLPNGRNVLDEQVVLDPFFAYLLGVVLADGTVSASGQVQLEMKDEQIVADIAKELGVEHHKRSDRDMYQMTVPRPVACKLVEYGVTRRKSQGFDVPQVSRESFGHMLRGLFDGDGSVRVRKTGITFRLTGHPRAMGDVQATLMQGFGQYLGWFQCSTGDTVTIETANRDSVRVIQEAMYRNGGLNLCRKREIFESFFT